MTRKYRIITEKIIILRSEWEPPEEAPAFEHWGASMWR